MTRQILQDIINDFSPDKFTRFFREKDRSFVPRREELQPYEDGDFKNSLKLGEIPFSASEKLLACAFQANHSLSERSGKKAQYEKGKKILKDTQSDAGIFIFYDRQGNFRFSLIYPQYIGRKRQWSNFRRFTYFVSPELTNKTFLTRVGDGDFSSLEKIKDAFSVEKVTKEFYEAYRKLFEALVADLNKNRAFQMVASKKQINTSDFAKKTLGQIVFLYFLQKKGWLGVPQNKPWGEGDKNFISNLYKQAVKKSENFYNDYLEILFYDTLNNANREGADPSLSKYFNCRIPFLNGGLFEPEYDWHGTKIYLENSVFRNIFEVFDRFNFTVEEESPDDKEVAVNPEMLGKVFENLLEENLRKGKGTYYTPREIVHYMCRESLINYLVTETKVDEKLIRNLVTYKEINSEQIVEAVNNEDARHRIADRTPVYWEGHQDPLIEKAFSSIKVCDPACGSGAFLVGILNEIVSVRRLLNPGKSEYQMKKEVIQNCIYGVDIDPGAVEIAKLRLWLSLVVDYELADIEPLPNLDYKIMCGNSLLEEVIIGDESIKLFDKGNIGNNQPVGLQNDHLLKEIANKEKQFKEFKTGQKRLTADNIAEIKKIEKEIQVLRKKLTVKPLGDKHAQYVMEAPKDDYFRILKELHARYFTEYSPESKRQIRKQIEDIELEFIKSSVDEKIKEIDTRIKNLNMQNPADRKKNAELMKKKLEYMSIPSEIHRSKVRPYFLWHLNYFEVFQEKGGFDVVIANPPYVSIEKFARSALQVAWRQSFKNTFASRGDIYCLFYEQGLALLRENGVLTFISSNKFQRAGYGKGLRKLLAAQRIHTLIDFCELPVFAAATDPMIVIVTKAAMGANREFPVLVVKDEAEFSSLPQSLESRASRYKSEQLKAEGWSLEGGQGLSLVEKFRVKGIPLGDCVKGKFYYGIKTGLNEAFVVDLATRDRLIREDRNSAELLMPWIRGKDIKRWQYTCNDLYLIKIPSSENARHDWSRKNEQTAIKVFKEVYPAVAKHLLRFEQNLRKRTDKGTYFWELRSCDYWTAFAEPKIVIADIGKHLKAAWSESGHFIGNTGYIIPNAEPFVLAVLLGTVVDWYARMTFQGLGDPWEGGRMRFINRNLMTIPIPPMSAANKSLLTKLAERAAKLAAEGDRDAVGKVDREIDEIVYRLFDLTPEEIAYIESSLTNTRGESLDNDDSGEDEQVKTVKKPP